jgi:hypothetical protein
MITNFSETRTKTTEKTEDSCFFPNFEELFAYLLILNKMVSDVTKCALSNVRLVIRMSQTCHQTPNNTVLTDYSLP